MATPDPAKAPEPAAPDEPKAGALASLAALVPCIALAATVYLVMTWLVYRLSIDTTTNQKVTAAFYRVTTIVITLIEIGWLLAIGLVTFVSYSLGSKIAESLDTLAGPTSRRYRRAAAGGLYLAWPLVIVTLVTLAIMPIQGRSTSFASEGHGVPFSAFVDAMTSAIPLMYIVLGFVVCVAMVFTLISKVIKDPGIGTLFVSVILGVAAVMGLGILGVPVATFIQQLDVGVTGRLYITFFALGLLGAIPMLLLRDRPSNAAKKPKDAKHLP